MLFFKFRQYMNLIVRYTRINVQQGTYAIPKAQIEREQQEALGGVKPSGSNGKDASSKKAAPKPEVVEEADDDEESMDWWTKYFASVDAMIEVCGLQNTHTSDTIENISTKFILYDSKVMPAQMLPVHLNWHFAQCIQICPVVESDDFLELIPEITTTPKALKMISQSVRDLTSISEVSGITKSTSELLTGEAFKKSAMRKKIIALGPTTDVSKRRKSESKTSLIQEDVDSITSAKSSKRRTSVASVRNPDCIAISTIRLFRRNSSFLFPGDGKTMLTFWQMLFYRTIEYLNRLLVRIINVVTFLTEQ